MQRPCPARIWIALSASLALPACGAAPESPTEPIDEPTSATPVVRVTVELPPEAPSRWHAELRGTLTAHVEAGLADLQGVMPVVAGQGVAIGLTEALQTDAEAWTAAITMVSSEQEGVEIGLRLCGAEGCVDHAARGTREAPFEALGALLEAASLQLEREAAPGAASTWALAPSADSYAVLMEGRSAATLYGILPPPRRPGDRKSDPVARAVHLDPRMPVAQWIAARTSQDPASGWASAGYARVVAPDRVAFRAAEAALYERAGKVREAWRAWEDLAQRAPRDARFAVPRARAALAHELPAVATEALDDLGPRFRDEAPVLALRVAIADVVYREAADDDLLARWEAASPANPEPVRRRIQLRVRDRRYQEALDMTPELDRRTGTDEATRLRVALHVALGELEDAAEAAVSVGEPALAARIRARAVLQADPRAVPPPEGLDDALGRAIRGHALLASERPAEALAQADAALGLDPWLPEALALRAEALASLGRPAADARSALRAADPAYSGGRAGPSTAPGATGSGAQSQPLVP